MKSVYFCVYLSKKSYPVVVAATGFSLVRPTGFEPAAFRVGVIRPSSRKPLRRKGLVEIAQISAILKKSLESLAGQDFQGFSW